MGSVAVALAACVGLAGLLVQLRCDKAPRAAQEALVLPPHPRRLRFPGHKPFLCPVTGTEGDRPLLLFSPISTAVRRITYICLALPIPRSRPCSLPLASQCPSV